MSPEKFVPFGENAISMSMLAWDRVRESEHMRLRWSSLWARILLGIMGVCAFGAGVVAVFITENGTGTGALITIGGVMLALAVLGDRVESLEFGGGKLRLRAAAAEKYALAEESDYRGDTAAAAQLRAEARALLEAAGPIASEYRTVRDAMPAGWERTMKLERIVADARQLGAEQAFEPDEVLRWLREGSEEERITALAMMQAKPELRNFDAMIEAIKDSRSAFEQYHAMLLAEEMLDELDARQRQRLGEAIRGERGLRFRRDGDRWALSERILVNLGKRSSGT